MAQSLHTTMSGTCGNATSVLAGFPAVTCSANVVQNWKSSSLSVATWYTIYFNIEYKHFLLFESSFFTEQMATAGLMILDGK